MLNRMMSSTKNLRQQPSLLNTSKTNDNPFGIVESECPIHLVCALCRPYAELQDDQHQDDPSHRLTPTTKKNKKKKNSSGDDDEDDVPIGLDDAQEEVDKCILDSRDDALIGSDNMRLVFQAPYLSIGQARRSTACETGKGSGPYRYLNGGSEYHPQIIWQWKRAELPLLQSSIGSMEWLREQHLHVAVESDGVCIGEAQIPLVQLDDFDDDDDYGVDKNKNTTKQRRPAPPLRPVTQTKKNPKRPTPPQPPKSPAVTPKTLTLKRNAAGRLGIRFDDYLRIHAASSWAKSFGIREGHRILKCQGQRVSTIKEMMSKMPKSGEFTVEVLYQAAKFKKKDGNDEESELVPPLKSKKQHVKKSSSMEKFLSGQSDNPDALPVKIPEKRSSMKATTPSLAERSKGNDANFTERLVPVYHKGRIAGILIVRFDIVSDPAYTNVMNLGILDPLLDEAEWAIERVRGMDITFSSTNSFKQQRSRGASVSQTILNGSEKVIRKMRRKSSKLMGITSSTIQKIEEDDGDAPSSSSSSIVARELASLRDENVKLRETVETLREDLKRSNEQLNTLRAEMQAVKRKAHGSQVSPAFKVLSGLRTFESFKDVLEEELPASPTNVV